MPFFIDPAVHGDKVAVTLFHEATWKSVEQSIDNKLLPPQTIEINSDDSGGGLKLKKETYYDYYHKYQNNIGFDVSSIQCTPNHRVKVYLLSNFFLLCFFFERKKSDKNPKKTLFFLKKLTMK